MLEPSVACAMQMCTCCQQFPGHAACMHTTQMLCTCALMDEGHAGWGAPSVIQQGRHHSAKAFMRQPAERQLVTHTCMRFCCITPAPAGTDGVACPTAVLKGLTRAPSIAAGAAGRPLGIPDRVSASHSISQWTDTVNRQRVVWCRASEQPSAGRSNLTCSASQVHPRTCDSELRNIEGT